MEYNFLYERADKIPAWNLIGASLVTVRENYAEIALPFNSRLSNSVGALHGGFVSTIVDIAGGWAIASIINPESLITTVELNVNFLNLIKEDVLAKARVLKCGSKIGVSSIEVCLKDGTITAVALGTYYFKPPNHLKTESS